MTQEKLPHRKELCLQSDAIEKKSQWRISFHKQFNHKYQHATDHGYWEQSGTEPCGDDSGNKCHQSGNRRLGSVDDGREGHDSQCHVRYIVQKGLNELILDRFPDQCQGQDTDRIGDGCHNGYVDIIIHLSGLLSQYIPLNYPRRIRVPYLPVCQ